jgi:serine/threonine protein kinase
MALNAATTVIGQQLGPYTVVAKLGEGGMGEVYRARDTRLDRVVAIKVLPSTVAADRASLERFQREAQVISSLDTRYQVSNLDRRRRMAAVARRR